MSSSTLLKSRRKIGPLVTARRSTSRLQNRSKLTPVAVHCASPPEERRLVLSRRRWQDAVQTEVDRFLRVMIAPVAHLAEQHRDDRALAPVVAHPVVEPAVL